MSLSIVLSGGSPEALMPEVALRWAATLSGRQPSSTTLETRLESGAGSDFGVLLWLQMKS